MESTPRSATLFFLVFLAGAGVVSATVDPRLMVASAGSDAEIDTAGPWAQTDSVVLTGAATILDDSSGVVLIDQLDLDASAAFFPGGGAINFAPIIELTELNLTLQPGLSPGSAIGAGDAIAMSLPLVLSGNLTLTPFPAFLGPPTGPHPFIVTLQPNAQGHFIRNPAINIYELFLVSDPATFEIEVPGRNPEAFEVVFTFNLLGGDIDGDGFEMQDDNCPGIPNASQTDSDTDGVGDVCDNCPGDPINDPDGDGICGLSDNCPTYNNPGQENLDGDAFGDPCDSDADGDGFEKQDDNCVWVANSGQQNSDSDPVGDACDNCPAVANFAQEDSDADGLGDACDPCPVPLPKLHPGDVLIADATADPGSTGPGVVFRQTVLSGSLVPYADSLAFAAPVSVAMDPFGDLIVADRQADPFQTGSWPGTVFRIDPSTCALTVAGWHADWIDPVDLAVDPLGQIWLADETAAAIYRTRFGGTTEKMVGKLAEPHAVSLRPGPAVFVSENDTAGAGRLYEFSLETGLKTEIAAGYFAQPVDLTHDGAGSVFALDAAHTGQLDRVDLVAGSASMFATDPAWDAVRGATLDDHGNVLVSNASKTQATAIYSTGPTGAVSILTADPQLDSPAGMTVVGLPRVATEPGFPFEINQLSPDTAFNPLKNEYRVVWEQNGDVVGRRVKPDGRVDRDLTLIFAEGVSTDPSCVFFPQNCLDPVPYTMTRPAVVHQVHSMNDLGSGAVVKIGSYLVVAEVQFDNGRSAIWARRYDDDFSVLTPVFNLTPDISAFTTRSATHADPAVAAFPTSGLLGIPFNGNAFVVVWETTVDTGGAPDGINAVLMDLSSPGSAPRFAVATGSGAARRNAAVAHGGDFLIAFERNNRIGARRVDKFGNVLDSVDLLISAPPATAAGARDPALDFNTAADEFLVVWTENRLDPAEIRARRIDSAGAFQGSDFLVDANPETPGNPFDGRPSAAPAVAAAGSTGEWFVTYEEYQENGTIFADPRGVFGRRVESTGVGLELALFRKAYGNFNSVLAHDEGRDEFLLLFEHDYDGTGSDFDIWGRLLENTDLDARPDLEDNCPRIPNSTQDDADNDGYGDLCDRFPFDAGNDADADGIGGDVDNCSLIPNGPDASTCSAGLPGGSCTTNNDCDNGVLPGICSTNQEDLDNDGLGDVCDADRDGDGAGAGVDCNDLDPTAFPGNPEVCDGIDNDCDGTIDSAVLPSRSTGLVLSKGTLFWAPIPDSLAIDLVVGDLGKLRNAAGDFSAAIGACEQDDYPGLALNYGASPGPGEAWFFLVRGTNCLGNGTYDTGYDAAPRDAGIAASGEDCL